MQLLPLLLQVLLLQSAEQLRVVLVIAAEVKRGLVGQDVYLTGKALSRCRLTQPRSTAAAHLAATPLLIKVGLLYVISGLLSDLEHTSLQLRILPALLQLPLDVEMVHSVDDLCSFFFFLLVGKRDRGMVVCVSKLGERHIGVVVVRVIELD